MLVCKTWHVRAQLPFISLCLYKLWTLSLVYGKPSQPNLRESNQLGFKSMEFSPPSDFVNSPLLLLMAEIRQSPVEGKVVYPHSFQGFDTSQVVSRISSINSCNQFLPAYDFGIKQIHTTNLLSPVPSFLKVFVSKNSHFALKGLDAIDRNRFTRSMIHSKILLHIMESIWVPPIHRHNHTQTLSDGTLKTWTCGKMIAAVLRDDFDLAKLRFFCCWTQKVN